MNKNVKHKVQNTANNVNSSREKDICWQTIEWLRERTEYIDIFLFSARHSIVFCFRCYVYW